jgi:hypothetical protein
MREGDADDMVTGQRQFERRLVTNLDKKRGLDRGKSPDLPRKQGRNLIISVKLDGVN